MFTHYLVDTPPFLGVFVFDQNRVFLARNEPPDHGVMSDPECIEGDLRNFGFILVAQRDVGLFAALWLTLPARWVLIVLQHSLNAPD